MLKFKVTESDMALLQDKRHTHPHPRVMLKMEVVYLKGLGLDNSLVCKITGVCGNTMREYMKQYMDGGVDKLQELNFYKPNSQLNAHSISLESYFKEHPPVSISQAAAKIEEITGIKRGETQTRKFLKSLNFRYMKSGSVPAKVLTEEKKTNNGNFWKKTSILD